MCVTYPQLITQIVAIFVPHNVLVHAPAKDLNLVENCLHVLRFDCHLLDRHLCFMISHLYVSICGVCRMVFSSILVDFKVRKEVIKESVVPFLLYLDNKCKTPRRSHCNK